MPSFCSFCDCNGGYARFHKRAVDRELSQLTYLLDFAGYLIDYTYKEVTYKSLTHKCDFWGKQISQFYCREDELRKLNKRYAGDKFECIVIYGRRRVGKTALFNEFCKDYIIGSCKYWNEKIGVDELDLIRDYASVFGKGKNYHFYIFSKGGFTDGLLQAQERREVQLITPEDLYK